MQKTAIKHFIIKTKTGGVLTINSELINLHDADAIDIHFTLNGKTATQRHIYNDSDDLPPLLILTLLNKFNTMRFTPAESDILAHIIHTITHPTFIYTFITICDLFLNNDTFESFAYKPFYESANININFNTTTHTITLTIGSI